jgi:phosphoribosylformimino-5-aminoimidazole carboxamide ribotide isomerase
LLGTDVRDGKLAINGWQSETDIEILPFLTDYFDRGGRQAFSTDISKDGLLLGPSTKLYEEIIQRLPKLDLIASGGVSSIQDVIDVRRIGCSGAIIGKAIYEKLIRLQDVVDLEEIERVS